MWICVIEMLQPFETGLWYLTKRHMLCAILLLKIFLHMNPDLQNKHKTHDIEITL